MIWNYCPACSHRVYQHNAKGCEHETQVHHIVRATETGFTLKHPLAERERDQLFDCRIYQDLGDKPPSWVKPGDYAIVENSNGGWSVEPLSKATKQCDCEVKHAELVMT